MQGPRDRIARIFREQDGFAVVSHANPDGDAIGSSAAVGHVLKALGKTFSLHNATPLPEEYAWLALPAEFSASPPPAGAWTVVLDCGDLDRMGPEFASGIDRKRILNIDHHLGNPEFGAVNWVDTSYASVGEMIAELADFMGLPLSGDLGEALYLAAATDTGFFTYGNTSPATMELAAELLRRGLDPGEVNPKIRNQWSLAKMKLWIDLLQGLELHYDGELAVVAASADAFGSTGATTRDTEGLVNFIQRVRGVRVTALLREEAPNRIKFSLRSMGGDNVQAVAASFGGGGHKNASGGTIADQLTRAKEQLIHAVGTFFDLA